MSSFKDMIAAELIQGLGTLQSLRDRDQLSLTPESEWADMMADKIVAKFDGEYLPFQLFLN